MKSVRWRALPITLALVAATGACRPNESTGHGRVSVVASMYPIAFAAGRVGGSRVHVTDLVPAGAEPHDLELSSTQLDDLLDADVAFVVGRGFQPAVEKAAARRDGVTVQLLPRTVESRGRTVKPEGESGGLDPHVWLDPVLMSKLVVQVERALAKADPEGRRLYERNARALEDELGALDADYRQRLAGCRRNLLMTSHEAFGYLASRYGLRQEGVSGLSPDAEPDPQRLGDLADLARRRHVTTIFTEENLSPRIADTLAREAGGLKTEVLSPIESLTPSERAARDDYFSLMDANLRKITRALGCPQGRSIEARG